MQNIKYHVYFNQSELCFWSLEYKNCRYAMLFMLHTFVFVLKMMIIIPLFH